jgi:hypothetical protein
MLCDNCKRFFASSEFFNTEWTSDKDKEGMDGVSLSQNVKEINEHYNTESGEFHGRFSPDCEFCSYWFYLRHDEVSNTGVQYSYRYEIARYPKRRDFHVAMTQWYKNYGNGSCRAFYLQSGMHPIAIIYP